LPDASFPAWQVHPDVWLLVGLMVAGYATAIVRLGPLLAPAGRPAVTTWQAVCFGGGVLAVLVASDWPIHDVAEEYLFSVHMVQHAVYSVVAAPLLLLGLPTWLARWVLSPPALLRVVRFLARFIPAVLLYNAVVVVTHIPSVVDAALHSGFVHFSVHAVVLVSALVVWLPIVSPLPEVPRFAPLVQMLFLFLQSVVPTIPASFLTFGSRPLYRFYEQVPRLWGVTAMDDMRVAGLIMKIAVGVILWVVIAIVFFRWSAEEERRERSATPAARELDLDLSRMGLGQ